MTKMDDDDDGVDDHDDNDVYDDDVVNDDGRHNESMMAKTTIYSTHRYISSTSLIQSMSLHIAGSTDAVTIINDKTQNIAG